MNLRTFIKMKLFAIIILQSLSASARVFDFSRETFASYLSYVTGPSNVKKSPFLDEANTTYTYSDEFANNISMEFGFVYSTPRVAFRFAFEFIKPLSLSGVTAKNSGGTTVYTLNSDLTGYTPKLGVELSMLSRPTSRLFLLVEAGSSSISLTNNYTLTATGAAAFPTVANTHTVEESGTATMWSSALAYEMWMNDSTTLVFELGYQSLNFAALTYSKTVTTFMGSKSSGAPVLDQNGLARSLNFSYYFGTLGFRIYM